MEPMQQNAVWESMDAELRSLKYDVYEASRAESRGTYCCMVRGPKDKKLAVAGKTQMFAGQMHQTVKLCTLTTENANAMMDLFPFTKPSSHRGHAFTLGLGDRIGLAAPGQLQAIRGYDVFPVLAQQSIRELNLTHRSFPEVIAAAAFGVFQSGYRGGYGADGDHLKTKEEIRYALDSGCSMITLDCSEQIDNVAACFGHPELEQAYAALPREMTARYEHAYLGLTLPVIGCLDADALKRIVLVFDKAISHAIDCGRYIQQYAKRDIDFELSIDEARTITTPAEHFVIAAELQRAGITPTSVAPHFVGEFEKGIEYQGDLEQFAKDLAVHQQIADYFSYKLSLHSGSDKFTVFPTLYRVTKGHVHVKTAGTNWLEAVRVIAGEAPELYRKAQKFALEHRSEAASYYHVTTDPATIQNIDLMSDAYLPEYLQLPASRQLMHISYGLLLSEPWFRDAFFSVMHEKEQTYYAGLVAHISRHLRYLTSN